MIDTPFSLIIHYIYKYMYVCTTYVLTIFWKHNVTKIFCILPGFPLFADTPRAEGKRMRDHGERGDGRRLPGLLSKPKVPVFRGRWRFSA